MLTKYRKMKKKQEKPRAVYCVVCRQSSNSHGRMSVLLSALFISTITDSLIATIIIIIVIVIVQIKGKDTSHTEESDKDIGFLNNNGILYKTRD